MASLFGIELNPFASELLAVVETHYGTRVREEVRSDWEDERYGKSSVTADGQPVIAVNERTGRNERTIVHELFHLHLKADGFPDLGLRFNDPFFRSLLSELWDTIQHFIIYPRMRAQGLDPDEHIRTGCEEAITRGYFLGAPHCEDRTVRYCKAALEVADEDLLNRLEALYQRRFPECLAIANRIIETVRTCNPATGQAAAAVLVECMNILFERIGTFALSGWQTQQMGTHRQLVAGISFD